MKIQFPNEKSKKKTSAWNQTEDAHAKKNAKIIDSFLTDSFSFADPLLKPPL
jgi:hypothetical protein